MNVNFLPSTLYFILTRMKVLVLYRPHSEHARRTEEFQRDYKQQTSKDLELMDVDTRKGQAKAEVYGAMDYPAFLALREDTGGLRKMWQGEPLPMISDISYYDDGSSSEPDIQHHKELKLRRPKSTDS